MTAEALDGECAICAKHRGRGPLGGPLIWQDDHVMVYHRPADDDGTAFLGYLFVESRRHAPYLADLTDAEAAAAGIALRRAARGLRRELNAEFVFSAIVGRGVPHFHQHVFVRHPGTPAEYGPLASDEWPDAPRADQAALKDLCASLQPYLRGTA